jgi:hypothetical protein
MGRWTPRGAPPRSHVERRINPTEADVVRAIFRLYAQGHGFTTIAKQLNAQHAISPCPPPHCGQARELGAHISAHDHPAPPLRGRAGLGLPQEAPSLGREENPAPTGTGLDRRTSANSTCARPTASSMAAPTGASPPIWRPASRAVTAAAAATGSAARTTTPAT